MNERYVAENGLRRVVRARNYPRGKSRTETIARNSDYSRIESHEFTLVRSVSERSKLDEKSIACRGIV